MDDSEEQESMGVKSHGFVYDTMYTLTNYARFQDSEPADDGIEHTPDEEAPVTRVKSLFSIFQSSTQEPDDTEDTSENGEVAGNETVSDAVQTPVDEEEEEEQG